MFIIAGHAVVEKLLMLTIASLKMREQWNTDASKDGKFHQRPVTSPRVAECCVTSLRVAERSEDLVKLKKLTHSVLHSGCLTGLSPLSRKDRITDHIQIELQQAHCLAGEHAEVVVCCGRSQINKDLKDQRSSFLFSQRYYETGLRGFVAEK